MPTACAMSSTTRCSGRSTGSAPGLDNMHAAKEGSSRVITQFLGHIVRGENVRLVDGGRQRRCFTGISDGIDALMKMIENSDGRASRRDLQRRQSGQQPVGARARAARCSRLRPPIRSTATTPPRCGWSTPRPPSTTARATRTWKTACRRSTTPAPICEWSPRVSMQEALRQIFDAYRGEIAQAGQLLEQETPP